MSILLAPSLVISPSGDLPNTYPLVLWDNKVTAAGLSADSATTAGPVGNLANPDTVAGWVSGSTAEQLVTITGLTGQSDCIGIARHNLGSAGVEVSVEGITAASSPSWVEVFPGALLATDDPAMLVFDADYYTGLRLRLIPDGTAPQAAVLFAGLGLRIERGLQPGFTPIIDGRDVEIVNGRSESGEFLGSIVVGAGLSASVEIKALSPTWYRTNMRPFIEAANGGASFFFAWNPEDYPSEVGYCWLAAPARPVTAYMGGRELDIALELGGLAL